MAVSRASVNRRRRRQKRRETMDLERVKNVLSWTFEIVLVIAMAFVLVYFVGEKTSVIGASMEPTLYNKNEVIINKFIYKLTDPKRWDVVVFRPNGNKNTHFTIKRVVGLPGETIKIESGKLYIDGEEITSEFIENGIEDAGIAEDSILLGEDEYFVLGENLTNSEDSRFANVGNVDKQDIEGKVWFRVSPFKEIGFVK
ncbi:MAG: signal peptidase I [Lachnospiraceae bacterium]|nr:signal peptidase I [Lachnospiraceae bacterium]